MIKTVDVSELGSYEADRARLGVDRELEGKRATFRERIDCWKDTQHAVSVLRPPPPPSVKLRFDASRWEALRRAPPAEGSSGRDRTEVIDDIRVDDADTIDCALALLADGLDPVALNLADDCMPGGCVDLGSGAQEESLFRRTTLCGTLDLSMYPILDDEGIYSPGVAVLKTSEADGWAPVTPERRRTLAFLTVPGVKYPAWDRGPDDASGCGGGTEGRLKPRDAERLAVKVRLMLQIALDRGHDSVVLGASGCGAWKCPPAHVAEVFRDVLQECRGAFRVVTFAILRTPASGERSTGNFGVFSNLFSRGAGGASPPADPSKSLTKMAGIPAGTGCGGGTTPFCSSLECPKYVDGSGVERCRRCKCRGPMIDDTDLVLKLPSSD